MQKKHALANAEKTIKPKGAALRAAPFGIIIFCIGQGIFFLHWSTHVFSAFGQHMFFLHLAHPYFFRYFLLAVAQASPRYF